MSAVLHWETDGPRGAQPLVLLGSAGTSTEIWDPVIGKLSEQFQVVRVDIRGHGRSPASDPGAPYSITDLCQDVLAVLEQFGAQRVNLAGLGLGGMVALRLAAHHPDRIGRLVLLGTSPHPTADAWLGRAAAVRSSGMASMSDAIVAPWVTTELAERDPDLVRRLATAVANTDAESYAQCCEAIATFDIRADLGRIAAPTLVIAGRDDPLVPADDAEMIARNIDEARLEVVSAAHLPMVEQSARVANLMLEHLGGGATLSRGYATRRAILGDELVDRSKASTTEFTAPFQDFLTRYVWGDVWTRPGLGRRERSIATLASVVSLGAADEEIVVHVRAGLRNGLTHEEISELLLHMAVYAGVPRAHRAFGIAQKALGD